MHSGIVWRDKIYSDRRQICERVENEVSPFDIKMCAARKNVNDPAYAYSNFTIS